MTTDAVSVTGTTLRPVTPQSILVGKLAELLELAERADRADLGYGADGAARAAILPALRQAHALAAGLDPYVARCTTPESPGLRAIAVATVAHDWDRPGEPVLPLEAEMLSGHVEGQLLKMLVHTAQARRVLDVGMFTGYSALAMAEALPDGGRVVSCEVDAEVAELAQGHFRDVDAGQRIDVRVGPAGDTLDALAGSEEFDLVFLDADKAGYLGYLRAVLDHGLLAAHGLICADNTLMQGQPWNSGEPSTNGAAIAAFNRAVADDPQLEQVLVPIRDGLTVIRRVAQT